MCHNPDTTADDREPLFRIHWRESASVQICHVPAGPHVCVLILAAARVSHGGCSDDGGLDEFFGVLFSRASSSEIFTSNIRMIACDSGGCCASNSSVISSDIQNVVADSFYQGQVTFTCFSKQPVNAYPGKRSGALKLEARPGLA